MAGTADLELNPAKQVSIFRTWFFANDRSVVLAPNTFFLGDFQRVVIEDQKASAVQSGAFTAGAWRTRDLNTVVVDSFIRGFSLASNQFVLPIGTYLIFAKAGAHIVDLHQLRLQNITDSITTLSGISSFVSAPNGQSGFATMLDTFSISASITFELQHRCETTKATDGFGPETASILSSDINIYSVVNIWKIV